MTRWEIMTGDVRDRLSEMAYESVDCVVTSPPYWGLRDYGADGQLGREPTPEAYVESMVKVFREVRRVLKGDGTLWLNLGDSYASNGIRGDTRSGFNDRYFGTSNGRGKQGATADVVPPNVIPPGLKPKDLVGIPWRVAFALQADGWWLRSDIIWHKPNPMPESVRDRPTKAHEYVFLLSKSERYHYDADAIAQPAQTAGQLGGLTPHSADGMGVRRSGNMIPERGRAYVRPDTRNRRSVWSITTKPFPEAHFATFPPDLPELCIKAGCPEGGTVLDPFSGAGTTGLVALRLGRSYIGIELNEDYAEMSRRRIDGDCPLFNRGTGKYE
jgi:DNA modification methylase